MKSKLPRSTAASVYFPAISRIRGSSAATRRGVNARETRPRIAVCSGGSMARNEMNLDASGVHIDRSIITPFALENAAWSRNPVSTSSYRDSAQKSSSSFR